MRRAVATFHDLFVMTGEYSTAEFRARFTAQARDAAARADAVITVSAFTREQVIGLLGADPARVHVVHHGIRQLEDTAVLPVERKKIVLNVGAIQKRKNIARLVDAFEGLPSDWQLVLAGSGGYGAAEILARIERSPAQARIRVTGYVSPQELGEWYRRASIFAFPSLDEGFGMPVLEAMAAGVPVITSDRSALPEVAGGAALLVNPEDTEGLQQALRRLSEDGDLRSELARLGTGRARNFTWEKAVRETWDVYQTLLR
jgi:glycosyltransferase involved in cell wall biosynthesis